MHCALIMGKARVVLLKRPTIPQMEPQIQGSSWGFGALLKGLTSVMDTPCKSRDSNPQPWVISGFKSNTLSIRELQLCLNTSEMKAQDSEHSRQTVTTILKGSSIEQWNHVDTASNPAECASRGQKVYNFLLNEKWISGFIYQSPDEWSKNMENMDQEVSFGKFNTEPTQQQFS